jgi:MarR family transcriptional regulator, organic hydroperoxide resistance regulator
MTREPESPASTVGALAVEDERGLQLGQQLCFAVHVAARAYDGVYRRVLADLGLTYPQYLVMLVLWEHGDLPVKRLGEFLRLDSGTLSPLLKRMEGAGLVVRERTPDDERSVTVMLTDQGRALKERARSVPLTLHRATGLTLDELIDLRTRLERLSAALDESAGRD